MSNCALTWAWKQKTGSSSRKSVLISMADRASEDFICYPSIKRIMLDTELSRNTIIKVIDELEELGFIRWTGETRGTGVKVYQIIGAIGREDDTQSSTNFDTSNKNATSTNFDKSSTNFGTPTSTNFDKSSTNFGTQNHQNHHKNHKEPKESVTHAPKNQNSKNPKSETKSAKPKITYQPPDDFAPTDRQIQNCREYGLNPFVELENFVDWAIANGKGYADWSRALSTWIKNSNNWKKPQPDNRMDELRQMANSNPTCVFVNDLPTIGESA